MSTYTSKLNELYYLARYYNYTTPVIDQPLDVITNLSAAVNPVAPVAPVTFIVLVVTFPWAAISANNRFNASVDKLVYDIFICGDVPDHCPADVFKSLKLFNLLMTVALVPLSDNAEKGQLKLNAGNWLAFVFVMAETNGVVVKLPNLPKLFIIVKLAHWENVDVNAVNNDVWVVGSVNVFKFIHCKNVDAKLVKDVETVAGKVKEVNDIQPLNVLVNIVQPLILVGIVTEIKDLQLTKQEVAVVTKFIVDGKVTLVSDKQLLNVFDKVFADVILVGIVIDSNLPHDAHIDAKFVILFWALFGNINVFRFWQLLNARFKLVIVQPDGITIEDREIQLSNADAIVIVDPTDVGRVTDVNLLQLEKQLVKTVKFGIGDCQITFVSDEQFWNALSIVVALKFSGKVMVFKLGTFWNVDENEYCAFAEHVAGKYTFCKR